MDNTVDNVDKIKELEQTVAALMEENKKLKEKESALAISEKDVAESKAAIDKLNKELSDTKALNLILASRTNVQKKSIEEQLVSLFGKRGE